MDSEHAHNTDDNSPSIDREDKNGKTAALRNALDADLADRARLDHRIARLSIELEQTDGTNRAASPGGSLEGRSALSTTTKKPIELTADAAVQDRDSSGGGSRIRSTVDLMAVSFNSQRWLPGFLKSLSRMNYPVERLRLVIIDNGSKDQSVTMLKEAAATLPFTIDIVETGQNLGFAGGHNVGFQHGKSDYYFVVNLDTEIEPDAIDKLVAVMENDPRVGIAEARQSPNEHPKHYDAVSGETSWCSGACMMIRPQALREIGGGFEEMFFMYLEDVDLSWRMWLHGWKCIYVPDAVIQHFTEGLNTEKHPGFQHFMTMRNSALMRAMYASKWDVFVHYLAMLRVSLFSRNPGWHKKLTLKAIGGSLRRLGKAFRLRGNRGARPPHKWVFFNGWLYGRHSRDPGTFTGEPTVKAIDLVAALPEACVSATRTDCRGEPVVALPVAMLGDEPHSVILAFDTARLEYSVFVPPGGSVCGYVGAPPALCAHGACGRFTIEQDGRKIWECELSLDAPEGRAWKRFSAPLTRGERGLTSRISFTYRTVSQLASGLWGDIGIHIPARLAPSAGRPQSNLAVSVVMPTHNRAEQLRHVVRRLMSQDMPPSSFEVIVVDSKCSDHTPQVLRELAAEYPNLSHVRCEVASVAATRNMGMDRAKGPLVVLLDDDILVGSDFLPRILRTARRRPGRILLARIAAPWADSCDPFERFLWQSQDVNIYDFHVPDNVPPTHFYTAAVAIPREVLRDIRFDETFKGAGVEDIEFGFRLLGPDARMVFMPDVEVLHQYFPKYRPYREKKYRHGYWLGYFLDRHPIHRGRFQFEPRIRRFPRLLRLFLWIGSPAAAALYLFERAHYSTKPLNRWLYQWMYHDLRLKMYKGMRDFKKDIRL